MEHTIHPIAIGKRRPGLKSAYRRWTHPPAIRYPLPRCSRPRTAIREMRVSRSELIDLSHTVEAGMVTYKG
ncbi:MAG TPA: hypothetical protein VF142_02965, partial [Longimicrobium sp.]